MYDKCGNTICIWLCQIIPFVFQRTWFPSYNQDKCEGFPNIKPYHERLMGIEVKYISFIGGKGYLDRIPIILFLLQLNIVPHNVFQSNFWAHGSWSVSQFSVSSWDTSFCFRLELGAQSVLLLDSAHTGCDAPQSIIKSEYIVLCLA